MQAFELYFNPKKKDDLFLHSFVYEPTSIYEKRLGNLYVVGELTQALPQNTQFLANLSSVVKKEYYSSGLKKSCEASLQEALKKGNVGWLGNLNFTVLNFKDPVLNFAKVGNIKVFLARSNELADISQGLDVPSGAPPDPLKVFGSIVEGKLSADDKIIVLNKSILAASGKKQNLLGALAKAADEKSLRQVLKTHQEVLAGTCGLGLVLLAGGKENVYQTVTFQKDLPIFSFSDNLIKPVARLFAKTPKINLPKLPRPSLPKLPRIHLVFNRKKIILVAGLILVLAAFYYIFAGEREREIKDAQQALNEAQTKAMLAESLLILQEDDKAKAIFEEVLDILSPLTKKGRVPPSLREEALSLQDSIKEYLK